MTTNNRQQRCIELFEKLKGQFLRAIVLDNAENGFQNTKKSDAICRQTAARDAAVFITLLTRLTSHMDIDDFNTNWFYYSDYIYQDEDLDCQHAIESKQKEESDDDDE